MLALRVLLGTIGRLLARGEGTRLDLLDVTLTLEKRGGHVSHVESRDRMQHRSCEDVVASIERLEASDEMRKRLQTATN